MPVDEHHAGHQRRNASRRVGEETVLRHVEGGHTARGVRHHVLRNQHRIRGHRVRLRIEADGKETPVIGVQQMPRGEIPYIRSTAKNVKGPRLQVVHGDLLIEW